MSSNIEEIANKFCSTVPPAKVACWVAAVARLVSIKTPVGIVGGAELTGVGAGGCPGI